MRRLVALVVALGLYAGPPTPAGGQVPEVQRQIAASRLRLEEIRAERERLQAELDGARGGVRDISRELGNIERQISASRSVLAELEMQLEMGGFESEQNALILETMRETHVESTATLHQRLRDAYKLGPLHTVRFLLGADSFSDLLNRYRYIEMLAAYDRALLQRVARLEADLRGRGQELQANMAELGRIRRSQLTEVATLRSVESDRQSALETFHAQEEVALSRLEGLDRDHGRMQALVDDLDARRVDLEQRRVVAGQPTGAGALAPVDVGTLEWPVQGAILYRFGTERRADGTTLRWNGIGISARAGTAVQAVRAGTVVLSGPFEGYGPTVILSHGEGYYTLYLYLEDLGVVEGRQVEAGQVVGTVGGGNSPEGPHLEFQIRVPSPLGGSPEPQDPLPWLRPRPGLDSK